MADSATYAISTVTRGMCLETRANGTLSTGVYDRSGMSQAQLWTIEQDDDNKSVAFRNVSNGQYLRSAGKGDRAKAQYGIKSWWTLEPGDAPALWWLKCNDTLNYLANYGGSQAKNNTVLMWASNPKGWGAALQWYVHPAKAGQSFSFTAGGDLAASLKQREGLDAREKTLKDREQQLEAREKGVVEKEDAIQKQAEHMKAKEADMEKRERQMETDQKVLIEKQEQAEKREQAVSSSETGGKDTGGVHSSTQIFDLQRQLANAKQELSKTRATLDKQAASTKSSARNDSRPAGSGSSYSGVSSDEVVKLRSRILELESQLDKKGQSIPASTRGDRPERGDLRPIIMQQNFAYLPRLADSELKYPLRVLSPAASVR